MFSFLFPNNSRIPSSALACTIKHVYVSYPALPLILKKLFILLYIYTFFFLCTVFLLGDIWGRMRENPCHNFSIGQDCQRKKIMTTFQSERVTPSFSSLRHRFLQNWHSCEAKSSALKQFPNTSCVCIYIAHMQLGTYLWVAKHKQQSHHQLNQ